MPIQLDIVTGAETKRSLVIKDNEVAVLDLDDNRRVTAFGYEIPAYLSWGEQDISGGIYFWRVRGDDVEGIAGLSREGIKIPVGGYGLLVNEAVSFHPDPSKPIKHETAGNAAEPEGFAQLKEDIFLDDPSQIVRLTGLPLEEPVILSV